MSLTKHLRPLTVLLAVLASPLNLTAQTTVRYKVRHITTVDGLPSNTIRAIKQDPYGFLWMGGTNGLSRYDGYRFVPANRFGVGADRDRIKNIGLLRTDDHNGLLWATTSTNTYGCYDPRYGRFLDIYGDSTEAQTYTYGYNSSRGLWLYSRGICQPFYHNGSMTMRYYTEENHALSDNIVHYMTEDTQHRAWAATHGGLVVIDTDGKTHQLLQGHDILSVKLVGDKMVCLEQSTQTCYVFDMSLRLVGSDKLPTVMGILGKITEAIVWQGRCYYFTNEATYMFDPATHQFSKPANCQILRGQEQACRDGYSLVANHSGTIWIFPPKGDVRKIVLAPTLHSTNAKNKVYSFAHDKQGIFYIATYGLGLFTYNWNTGELQQYTANDSNPLVFSNYLFDVTVDRTGCIWVCAESGGISCIQPVTDIEATYYYIDPTRRGDWTNYVRYLYYGKDHQLYVSTKDGQHYRFDRTTNTFTHIGSLRAGIYAYSIDREGHEWMCTRGDGLYVDGVRYAQDESGVQRFPSNDFYNVKQDRLGRIWIASWTAGVLVTTVGKDGRLTPYKQFLNKEANARKVHDIEPGPDGRMYIATYNGLYVVDANKQNLTDNDFIHYGTDNGKLPNNEVKTVKWAFGYLWAGVMANGVVKCDFSKGIDRMTCRIIGQKGGLADNEVRTISEDKYGRLWVGCGSGLSCINPKDNSVVTYAPSGDDLSNSFTENGSRPLADGSILFGTENGMMLLRPKPQDGKNQENHRVSVTDLAINGTSIFEDEDTLLLDSALNITEKIRLDHNQNSLTLYYSNFNYTHLQSQLYQVRLDGVDTEWRHATTDNFATYTNLSPGTYRFRVRCLNGNEWSDETALTITIGQPWYNTWWAWLIYLTIVGLLLTYFYRNTREKFRLHQQVKLEKQITDFRLNFFTHVTHEFRTPLAIIQNGVSQLQDPQTKTISRTALQTTQRGTKRLLRLVNQLMEFRKLSTGNMKLNVEQGDIVEFVRQVWYDLWSIANQKEINYTFTPFAKHHTMVFDHQFVETIVYNLLSNALKYTSSKGTVTLTVKRNEETKTIVLTVEDNGKGISPEQQKKLFTPFMHGYVSKGGMGIGLFTAHQLAESHHGRLDYEDVTDGHGTIFRLTLPDEDLYEADEHANTRAIIQGEAEEKMAETVISQANAEAINHQTVAIIEDDTDMLLQLREAISPYFQAVGFTNGKDGYEGVLERKPDLVLCDVMLPDMDGYDIVRRIKADASMVHTPIVMLTALDDEDHQIKGYQAGADDYMVKPCNFRLLIARIIQLIKWREAAAKLAAKQAAEQGDRPSAEQTVNTAADKSNGHAAPTVLETKADKIFKDNVQMYVAQHIADPTFSIDMLAQLMCMGRSKFYGKMKEIYGISPNKYVVNERMRIAAELLVEGRYTIAEISMKVGIQDPSHFNKSFKAIYGVPPSKYKG